VKAKKQRHRTRHRARHRTGTKRRSKKYQENGVNLHKADSSIEFISQITGLKIDEVSLILEQNEKK